MNIWKEIKILTLIITSVNPHNAISLFCELSLSIENLFLDDVSVALQHQQLYNRTQLNNQIKNAKLILI